MTTGPIFYNRSLKCAPPTRLCILCILLHMSQALVNTVPLSRTSESTQGREEITLAFSCPCDQCVLGSKVWDYPDAHWETFCSSKGLRLPWSPLRDLLFRQRTSLCSLPATLPETIFSRNVFPPSKQRLCFLNAEATQQKAKFPVITCWHQTLCSSAGFPAYKYVFSVPMLQLQLVYVCYQTFCQQSRSHLYLGLWPLVTCGPPPWSLWIPIAMPLYTVAYVFA